MATYTGFLLGTAAQEDPDWINVSASFGGYADDLYPYHELHGSLGAGSNSRINNLPITMAADTQPGALAGSFGALDWYERIHIVPAQIDLGNLVGSQVRTVEVWNAFFISKHLSGITAINGDGITITPPILAPTTYGALESRIHDLAISLSGPPKIDAKFVFNFPSIAATLAITGSRVVAFAAFGPNWREPITERLIWLTDVITARDGTEQRVQLREIPRREIEFTITARGIDLQRLDAILWGWQSRVYALPIWMDPGFLAAALPIGATTIPITTTYRDYAVGSLAILAPGSSGAEIVEVATVAANQITLARPTQSAWPAGTRITPARLGRIGSTIRTSRHSAATAEARIVFEIEPLEPIAGIAGTAPAQYLGADTYLVPPNRVAPLDEDLVRALEYIDGDTGPRAVADPVGQSAIIRTYRWLVSGRPAISAHRYWLTTRKGRQISAWVPTWTIDAQLAAVTGTGDTTIVISDIGYRLYYAMQPGRRDIALRAPDGSLILRRIVGADQAVIGQERLQLDSATGLALPIGTVIHFLGLHRLDTDRIEIAWHTPEVIESAANLRLLKQ